MSHHISTWTNLSYVGTALAVLTLDWGPEAWVAAAALVLLAVGSWGMHNFLDYGHLSWESFDHAGIHATYSVIAVHALGGAWWLMLVTGIAAPLVLEVWRNADIDTWAGTYMVATLLGGIISGRWLVLLIGFALMGLGYAFHRQGGDHSHAIWHVSTAAGTVFLYLIGAPSFF